MKTTTDFARHITRFFSIHLTQDRNVSPNTIASYRTAFVLFMDFMETIQNIQPDMLQLKHINRENALGYLRWLLEVKGNSVPTRNNRIAAIYSFARYLQHNVVERMEQWQDLLSIKVMKSEEKAMNYITTEGMKLLLSQPDMSTPQGRRHLAILSLMYDTGARVQEICDVKVKDLRISCEPYSIVLHGKGRKSRLVPLAKEEVGILLSYMEEWHLDSPDKYEHFLFFNHLNNRLTRQGISHILNKYVKNAKAENPDLLRGNISCHTLRHSRAMALLQAGVNLIYIRDILGHVSIQTTEIYARADSKAKRDAFEAAYRRLTPENPQQPLWDKNKDLKNWLKTLGK